jgi:hypothetical protein
MNNDGLLYSIDDTAESFVHILFLQICVNWKQ